MNLLIPPFLILLIGYVWTVYEHSRNWKLIAKTHERMLDLLERVFGDLSTTGDDHWNAVLEACGKHKESEG